MAWWYGGSHAVVAKPMRAKCQASRESKVLPTRNSGPPEFRREDKRKIMREEWSERVKEASARSSRGDADADVDGT